MKRINFGIVCILIVFFSLGILKMPVLAQTDISQNQNDSELIKLCNDQGKECQDAVDGITVGCGATRVLKAADGSSYTWQLTGTGTLSSTIGDSVQLTAPSSNDGCINSATLELKDSSSNVVQSIKISYNCDVTSTEAAFGICKWGYTDYVNSEGVINYCEYGFAMEKYNCNGEYLGIFSGGLGGSTYGPGARYNCPELYTTPDFKCSPVNPPPACCEVGNGGVIDLRTDTMKQQGCCPAEMQP